MKIGGVFFIKSSWILSLLLTMCVVVFSSCSSSIFTGDHKNDQPPNIHPNQDCFGMDLSKQTLDVATAKALLRCLNANGSLQPYVDLVNKRLNDAQFGTFVDLLNQQLLVDSRLQTLKNVHDSFDQMDQQGVLKSVLEKWGEVLSNKKFVSSFLKILHQGAMPHETFDPKILKAISILSRELAQSNGSREGIRKIVEIGLKAVGQPYYQEITQGLRLPIFGAVPLRMISYEVLDYLQEKLRSPKPMGKIPLWGVADGTFLTGLDHYLYDECEGVTPSQCTPRSVKLPISFQAQGFEYFIRFLTNSHRHLFIKTQDQDVLDKLLQLHRLMDVPLFCLDKIAKVPNTDLLVFQEFLEQDPRDIPLWMIRDHFIKLKIATGLCDYPEGLGDLIQILSGLADFPNKDNPRLDDEDPDFDHRMLPIFAHFVDGLNAADQEKPSAIMMADIGQYLNFGSENRYKRFLIDWLGDPTKKNSLLLSDMLRELTYPKRQFLRNVFYLYDAILQRGTDDRESVRYGTSVLMQVRDVLATKNPAALGTNPASGRSIYDMLSYGLANIDPETFADLVEGLSDFINAPTNYLQDLLNSTRQALLLNDVNPFIDIALDVGINAEKNSLLIQTFLELAGTKELEDAIAFTAKMAKNGDLKDLLKGILSLFKSTTDLVAKGPRIQSIPPLPTRSKTAVDLGQIISKEMQIPWVDDISSCLKINPATSFADTANPDWLDQFVSIGKCVNINGRYPEFQSSTEYLVNLKVNQKNLPAFLIDLVADLVRISPLTNEPIETQKELYKEISPVLLPNTEAFNEFLNFSNILKFTFWNTYCPIERATCHGLTVAQGAFRTFSVLSDQKKPLQNLLNLGAQVSSDPYLFKVGAFLYDLSSDADSMQPPSDSPPPPIDSNVIQDLKNKILKVELHKHLHPSEDELNQLVNQKIYDYWNQVQNQEHKLRYQDSEDLKQTLKPLLDNLSHISNKYAPSGTTDCDNGNFLECVLTFFYTMNQNPYDVPWFEGWLQRASSNIRAIYYYYPGQYPFKDKPTVRLVNTLDLLELVVLNADFSLKDIKGNFLWGPEVNLLFGDEGSDNFAIRFLTILAQCSNESDQAQHDLYYWLGLLNGQLSALEFSIKDPGLSSLVPPEAQRRQFNLRQIFPDINDLKQQNIFKQMADRNEVLTLPSGKKLIRNDLGLLRDLFKAVLAATPRSVIAENSTVKYHKDSNSLSFILELVKVGVLRNIGTLMSYQDATGVHYTKIDHILKALQQWVTIQRNSVDKINPDFLKTADYFLRRNHTSDTATTFNDRYVFVGQLFDRAFVWRQKTGGFIVLKQVMYDASLLIDFLDRMEAADEPTMHNDPENNLMKKIIKILTTFLSSPKAVKLIGDNLDLLDSFFSDPKSANMLHLLVQSAPYNESEGFYDFLHLTNHLIKTILDPKADYIHSIIDILDALYLDPLSRMRQTSGAWGNMQADLEYKSFKKDTIDPVVGQLLHWMVNADGTKVLPNRLQQHLSTHLTNGDLLNLISTIGEQSQDDRFFDHLQFLGRPDYVKGNQDFIKFLNASLVPNF